MTENLAKVSEYFLYKPYDAIRKLVFFKLWNKVAFDRIAAVQGLWGIITFTSRPLSFQRGA
jgi:hypothetical protein